MRNFLLIAFACIFVCYSSYASALSVVEAVQRIVNDSPELKIILENRIQAVESYKGARANMLPSVYLDYLREYQKNAPITNASAGAWKGFNQFEVTLQQAVFDISSWAGVYKNAYLVQSQEFENQKVLQSLIQLAVNGYYDVIQAQYVYAVESQYVAEMNSILKVIKEMKSKGNATLGDVSLVTSSLASAENDSLNAKSSLDKAKTRLSYLLNITSNMDSDGDFSNFPELSSQDFYDLANKMIGFMPSSLRQFQDITIKNNIDLLLIRSNLCSAGYDLEAQKGNWMPTVTASVLLHNKELVDQNSYERYAKVDLEAKYYIYDGGARASGVRNSESNIRELEYNYDVKVRDIKNQSYVLFNQLQSLSQQRSSVIKEIASSEQVDRIYAQQVRLGTRNLTDRMDNLSRLVNARVQLIGIDYSVLNARINVLVMLGIFVKFFGFQNYLNYSDLNLC